jgi:hypothetical protein
LGDHAAEALRKSHIEFWLGERRKTCAPVTLQFEVNLIRQIFNWGIDEST